MPIDPNIALGFKLPQAQIQNPIAQAAQAQELGLNALRMQEAQQGMEVRNRLRALDPNSPEYLSEVSRLDPKLGLELSKGRTQARTAEIEQRTKVGGLIKQYANRVIATPNLATAKSVLQQFARDTGEDVSSELATLDRIGENPDALRKWGMGYAATADQILAQTTINPYQQRSLAIQEQGQRMQYDPELQGRIAGAKATAQKAAEREVAGNIDVTSNRKALAQAGYDVATGKDEITDLIKKSTGSYLGKAVDISGRVFGAATEGSEALAALEQKANAITFGLLNGKLGAGISKSDAELVASLVGRLGDGTLPVDDRLAAWNSAKNMMKNLGMVAEPTGATKPTSSASNVGSNTVTIPGGKTLTFPTPEAAAAYKKAAGL